MIAAALIATVLFALCFAACKGWDDPSPSATASTPDYPCGALGVVCKNTTPNTCCWEGEACGGSFNGVGCPLGECCDVRDFDPSPSYGAALDGGVGLPLPRRTVSDAGAPPYFPFWDHRRLLPGGAVVVETDAGTKIVRPLHPSTPLKATP